MICSARKVLCGRQLNDVKTGDNKDLGTSLHRRFEGCGTLNADDPVRFTTVVSLCPELLREAQGITYIRIPIADAQPIPPAQFEEIMKTLAEQISRETILLVCAAGMSRSPIMAAAWLHCSGNLAFEAAMRHIGGLRPTIDPSPILLRSVRGNLSR